MTSCKNSSTLLITGTYPPEKCGVGDYSFNLLQSKLASDWKLYYSKDWKLSAFWAKLSEINRFKSKKILMQYPSIGYGFSILPHLLCIYYGLFSQKQIAVTIHEFTQLGWKGKFSLLFILFAANKLIFTNEFEKNAAIMYMPLVKRKSIVIKIFSNIPTALTHIDIKNRYYDVGYFGYLRPLKGLENFVDSISKLKEEDENIRVYVMGQTQPSYVDYYTPLLAKMTRFNVELILNKDIDEVANVLGNTKIAYLPFPDGVSERRGSFLAVVKNYCLIVTKKGPYTTKGHHDLCFFSEDMDSVSLIKNLLSKDDMFYNSVREKTSKFISLEMPQSWDAIVKEYNEFLS